MFKEAFKLDGKEFRERSSLAAHLKKNFKKSVTYISDGSLYLFLQNELPELYEHILELSKDFEHKENILTLIIYLLDNNAGIATPNHQFKTNHDIADAMKKYYPNINTDIKVLFHDKVLAHIFWNEFNKNYDSRFKRNYTFMLHVYENRMYDFTYYYYLFLHLAKNEVVRFTLDGIKMKSLAEITAHLANNIDRASHIIDEILNNPFILALMAIESGIDTVAATLSSKRTLEILKLLSTYKTDADLTPIIRRKMAYWLLANYTNYVYETEEAKELSNDYAKLVKNLSLTTIGDYVAIYDEVNALYQRFILLFNHNKLISFRCGISANDDHYLNYRFNDDYVCKRFLTDNCLYDSSIHTEIHRDSVEREVLVDALEVEKKEIISFRDEVLSLTQNLNFNKKYLGQRLFISVMYLLLAIASVFGGFLLGFNDENSINQIVNYGVLALLSISIVFLIICVVKYSKKLSDAELVELACENSAFSIEAISKEEELILNPNNKSFKNSTLTNSAMFSKNRKKDLAKIKKIAARKENVSSGLLILSATLALIPILEFGLIAVLKLFNIVPFEIYVNNIEFNVINLVFAVAHFVLLIIFRKSRFAYYFIYLYMIILAAISFII